MATGYQDYYGALGVSKTATAAEIQKAYRALARKYHPDVNKSPEASKRFTQVAEAYEVLKDADRRSRYDQFGVDLKPGQGPAAGGDWAGAGGPQPKSSGRRKTRSGSGPGRASGFGGDADFLSPGFSDFFNSVFGGGQGVDGFGQPSASRAPAPSELEISVPLSLAALGGQYSVNLTYPNGTSRAINVKIPKGTVSGDVLRLGGQGHDGSDLLLKLRVAADPRFAPDGRDLVGKLVISPALGAIGGKASVQLLDGSSLSLTIPPLSSSGRKLRLRGKGIPGRLTGQAPGDLILELVIMIPEPLTPDLQELYKAILDRETAHSSPATKTN